MLEKYKDEERESRLSACRTSPFLDPLSAQTLLQRNNSTTVRPLHFVTMTHQSTPAPQIALALADGGPLSAIYETGALCPPDESLDGLDFTSLHHYVGASAGCCIVAGLANNMSPCKLCAIFILNDNQEVMGDLNHAIITRQRQHPVMS